MNRAAFFASIRKSLYGGRLTRDQVSNIEVVLDAARTDGDPRCLAYILATAYHEAGKNFAPVREIGRGRGKEYGKPVNGHVYYGRGLVQLTWDYNYRKAGERLWLDLLRDPDLALRPDVAAHILIVGMTDGWFTGKKLADYFTAKKSDWTNARRIVNGVDRAALIAGYAKKFLAALEAARDMPATVAAESPEPADTFSAPPTAIAAMQAAMQPEGKTEMAKFTTVEVVPWYASKINWVSIVGFSAQIANFFGVVSLDPATQLQIAAGLGALQGLVTGVLKTWTAPRAVASQIG